MLPLPGRCDALQHRRRNSSVLLVPMSTALPAVDTRPVRGAGQLETSTSTSVLVLTVELQGWRAREAGRRPATRRVPRPQSGLCRVLRDCREAQIADGVIRIHADSANDWSDCRTSLGRTSFPRRSAFARLCKGTAPWSHTDSEMLTQLRRQQQAEMDAKVGSPRPFGLSTIGACGHQHACNRR
jgi:hypothetical protein